MVDLPAFCCYYKVVIDSTYVLWMLYCCEPGEGCQKLFAVLDLHKEMQTYSRSTGIKHAWEGNAVCKDIFGASYQQRVLWEVAPNLSGSWEQLKPRLEKGREVHKKLLTVTPPKVVLKLGISLPCFRQTESTLGQAVVTLPPALNLFLPWSTLAFPNARCNTRIEISFCSLC